PPWTTRWPTARIRSSSSGRSTSSNSCWTIRIASTWSGTGPAKSDSFCPAVIDAVPWSWPTRSTMPEASTVPSAGASSWNFSEDEPELMTRTRVSSAVSVMGSQLLGQRSVLERGGGAGRFRLRLDGGDDDGVDDVVDESSAGEVVDRLVQTLQDGADGDRPGRALD